MSSWFKLGIRISPRTVCKYMPKRPPGQPRGNQRWSTFLKNHAKAILACDFFVVVTATFRMLYVFVVIEHGTRRLAHINVTANPTADWTLQQLREVAGNGGGHRYLIHDRDRIFAKHLDDSIRVVESAGGLSPPAAHRTEHEPLDSLRSHQVNAPVIPNCFDSEQLAGSTHHLPPVSS